MTLAPRDEKHSFLLTKLVKGIHIHLIDVMSEDTFILENFDTDHKTYVDIRNEDGYWLWLRTVFFPLVYRDTYANGDLITDPISNNSAFVLHYNKIVGAIRMRSEFPSHL